MDIQFYSDSDKTLGQFLVENCFNSKLQCLNEKCKKPALQHILSYTHNSGRVVISVNQINDPLPDNKIIMWSRCSLCEKNVTPAVPMSEKTFAFSLGKFLEISFYNHIAIGSTSRCNHPVHPNYVRFFGLGNLVASFEFHSFEALKVKLTHKLSPIHEEIKISRLHEINVLKDIVLKVFDYF